MRFAKKARSRLAFLSKAIFDGIASDAVENLWRTIVRPTLEYGCEVWGGGKWLEAERIQLGARGSYCSTSVWGTCGAQKMSVLAKIGRKLFMPIRAREVQEWKEGLQRKSKLSI